MTEFMITVVSLGIIGALTYLIRCTEDPRYGWLLIGFIVAEAFTAVYALLYNLHGGSDDERSSDSTRP